MDVSAIMCDAEGTKVNSVYYKNKNSFHDAVILKSIKDDSSYFEIDLNNVSEEVSSIWFVVNIYRKSFDDVSSAKFEIMDSTAKIFC